MPLGQRGGRVAKRSRPKVLTVPLTRQGGAPPVQQRALGDRAGMGRPLPQGLAVALPGPADVAQRDGGKGISSTESTSICAGPAQYRPPGRTLGRRHSRKDTVMSPASTASRRSRLNSTSRCYACGPARQRPQAGLPCLPSPAARPRFRNVLPCPVRSQSSPGSVARRRRRPCRAPARVASRELASGPWCALRSAARSQPATAARRTRAGKLISQFPPGRVTAPRIGCHHTRRAGSDLRCRSGARSGGPPDLLRVCTR